ncbi:Uncharacterized protein APZ42_016962 [Daphnia magna]|uniref:Uncharacterized protein n=1 Tax=Daphnia magna TaxID=35525 RepID=A0A165A9X1_9CRUS|nr:Uncharacterized protein APZ42_016962 [Daphnia magna]
MLVHTLNKTRSIPSLSRLSFCPVFFKSFYAFTVERSRQTHSFSFPSLRHLLKMLSSFFIECFSLFSTVDALLR